MSAMQKPAVTRHEAARSVLFRMGVSDRRENAKYRHMFECHISDVQLVQLDKLAKFGWKLGKIYHDTVNGQKVLAILVRTSDCAAFLYPDGRLDRAPAGKSTVYLDKNWKEQV